MVKKKVKSKSNEEIDIDVFEEIFDEIKDNFKSVDGLNEKKQENNLEVKTEKNKDSEKIEIKEDHPKLTSKTKYVGSFEVIDKDDYNELEKEEKAKKKDNSIQDEYEII